MTYRKFYFWGDQRYALKGSGGGTVWGGIGGTLADQSDLDTALNAKADLAGDTFTGDISVPDEVYGVSWSGSVEVPTKNALYNKIETLTSTVNWGDIGGTLADQSDLDIALDGKEDAFVTLSHEKGGLEADVSAYNGLIKISGGTTSQAVAGTDYLDEVAQDTPPQLGGDLDGQGNDITNLKSINLGNEGSNASSNLLVWDDVFDVDTAVFGTVPRFADANPTVDIQNGGNPFGVGFLFYAHPDLTWSGGANFGGFYVLADQTEISLDQTTDRTMSGSASVLINPTFNTDSSGDMTISVRNDYWGKTQFDAGVTATTYAPFTASGPDGAGTVQGYAAYQSNITGSLTPNNYAHILLGTNTVPSGDFGIYQSSDEPNVLGGGLALPVRTITTTSNITTADVTIIYGGGSSATANLLSASELPGQLLVFKYTGSGGALLVNPAGADAIDGSSITKNLNRTNESLIIQSDGSDWIIW